MTSIPDERRVCCHAKLSAVAGWARQPILASSRPIWFSTFVESMYIITHLHDDWGRKRFCALQCPRAPHSRLNRSKEPTWNTPHSTDLRSLKGVGGGMNKLSKGYAVTKVPIVNKLLPLYVRLSHFPCRLLYVLNEFYINKGQLYGNEIAFFQKKSRVPGL